MQPLFSVSSIKAIEADYVKQQGIELYELMTRAGARAFERVRLQAPDASHWLIATGAGNNAGDGLVVAKHALNAGFDVTLVALKPYHEFSGDPERAWNELEATNISPHQSLNILSLEQFQDLGNLVVDIAVDALLGTGVKGELRKEYRELIHILNALDCYRVSLDIPTGIYAESGCVATAVEADEYGKKRSVETAFRADATVSFVALKTGQMLNQALAYQGQLIVEDLGIKSPLSFSKKSQANYVELKAVQHQLPKRSVTGSKFDCGHTLVVGGGKHLGGAAILSATTAIKSGSGMVSCWLDSSNQGAALSHCPEVMWLGFQSAQEVSSLLEEQLERFQAVALGPGLGRDKKAESVFAEVLIALKSHKTSTVFDADALYWLAQKPTTLFETSVITPHAGEAARLMNAREEDVLSTGRIEPQLSVDTAYVNNNRVKVAETLAKKYQTVCVLKGAGTVVSDGQRSFVTAGAHPAMITAGLGDVLTGLIASFMSQAQPQTSDEVLNLALLATNLHYEAAVSAANERTRGMLASEVIDELTLWINRLNQ